MSIKDLLTKYEGWIQSASIQSKAFNKSPQATITLKGITTPFYVIKNISNDIIHIEDFRIDIVVRWHNYTI